MDQIIIQVKNRKKAMVLIDFLKTLDFVGAIKTDMPIAESSGKENETDFFAMAGIWENREITLESLRKNSWPLRS